MTTAPRKVLIAAGGTGGHVFPAQALAQELLNKGWDVSFVLEKRGQQWKGFAPSINLIRIMTGQLGDGGLLKKGFSLFFLGAGFFQSLFHIYKIRPHVVIGFGGYPSFPVLMASFFYPVKRFIHEQNAILGRVNRWLYPFIDKLILTFPLSSTRQKTEILGLPVRSQIQQMREQSYPMLTPPLTITVLGGSQGAKIFSDVLPDIFKTLKEKGCPPLRIIQQCRPEFLQETQRAYQNSGIEAELTPFIEAISEVLVKSHLVISRAGASGIAEITTVGRPSILVPYPFAVDDHQTANALFVEKAKAGWTVQEPDLKKGVLLSLLIKLLNDSSLLRETAARAKEIGHANAANAFVQLIEKELEE